MIPVMTRCYSAAECKENFVAVAYIGDGGMSTGAFHEGLNFRAVQLPFDVVAEYNHSRLFHSYASTNRCRTPRGKLRATEFLLILSTATTSWRYEVTKQASEFARDGRSSFD